MNTDTDNTNGGAPQGVEGVETPTTTEPAQPAPAQPIDLGLTAEQAEKFKTFIANSGGFDNAFSKLKTDVSTPKSAQPAPAPEAPTSVSEPLPTQPTYEPPKGAITAQEFLAKQYFKSLSGEEKYASISKGIENGDYLKEMAAFGIKAVNPDGSINDERVRMYLDLKAQTVPAQPTGTEPGMSSAPTVEYYQVAGDKVSNMDDAYKILQQDMQPKAMGQAGHPLIQEAEAFIKTGGRPTEK